MIFGKIKREQERSSDRNRNQNRQNGRSIFCFEVEEWHLAAKICLAQFHDERIDLNVRRYDNQNTLIEVSVQLQTQKRFEQ